MFSYVCLLMNYNTAIPIPDKTDETVVQTYPQHIYANSRGFLSQITYDGKNSNVNSSKKLHLNYA